MSKDGPPISSGYRYGGREALRTGLPTSATALRSKPPEGDLEARLNLAKFANYPERTNSIGKPLPTTVGISEGQAACLRRIEELKQKERADMSVTIAEDGGLKIKWVFGGTHKYRLLEEDLVLGVARVSMTYPDKERAFDFWQRGRVRWIDKYSLP